MARQKIAALRIFDDENGVMNRNVVDVDGQVLVVSQFTLMASYKKRQSSELYPRRPPGSRCAALRIFRRTMVKTTGKPVETGVFGADMQVSLLNNGPVTITMDTHNKE